MWVDVLAHSSHNDAHVHSYCGLCCTCKQERC